MNRTEHLNRPSCWNGKALEAYFHHIEHNDIFSCIKGKKVLEIGTAEGLFWETYNKYDPLSVTGLDPDDRWTLIDDVKDSDIIRESYLSYLPTTDYDVIICFGLIYKLHSPIHLLELIASSKPEYIVLEDLGLMDQDPCELYLAGQHGSLGELLVYNDVHSRYVSALSGNAIVDIMEDMSYTLEKQTEYIEYAGDPDNYIKSAKASTLQFVFKRK